MESIEDKIYRYKKEELRYYRAMGEVAKEYSSNLDNLHSLYLSGDIDYKKYKEIADAMAKKYNERIDQIWKSKELIKMKWRENEGVEI